MLPDVYIMINAYSNRPDTIRWHLYHLVVVRVFLSMFRQPNYHHASARSSFPLRLSMSPNIPSSGLHRDILCSSLPPLQDPAPFLQPQSSIPVPQPRSSTLHLVHPHPHCSYL